MALMIANGQIRCVDEVLRELEKRDDDACAWAKSQDGLFVPMLDLIQLKARELLKEHPKLTGVGGGRNQADPFVIALAMTYLKGEGVVVTEETLTGNINKPRIPDVCNAIDIPWLSLIGFVKEQGWSF